MQPVAASRTALWLGSSLFALGCSAGPGAGTASVATSSSTVSGASVATSTSTPSVASSSSATENAPPPSTAASVAPPAAPVVRVRGAVEGRIEVERRRYAVGEPMLVTMELRNPGPGVLAFDVGGDYFDRAAPRRYNWVVRDAHGTVVCERAKDPILAGGGGGYVARVKPGEPFRETHLLNAVCDTFTRPGRYRLTVVRVLTQRQALPSGLVCDVLAPPALTSLAGEAPDPYGKRDPACMAALRAAPAIAADLELELTAYDAALLRKVLPGLDGERSASAKARDNSREGALSTYGGWFCSHVRCDCSDDVRWGRADDWFTQALSRIPDAMPASCPER